MRILSWNINGLATVLHYHPWSESKSFETLLNALEADIICLQEIKCQRTKLTRDMAFVPGYDGYFSFSKIKLGYSGVAIYVKQPLQPHWTEEGITGILNQTTHLDSSMDDFLATLSTEARDIDAEGRCIIMCLGDLVLINVYLPNESRGQFKVEYDACVRWRIEDFLRQNKQVVLIGDINTVHQEIDHCDPPKAVKAHDIQHFSELPFRGWVDELVSPPNRLMVDLCREFHPDRKGMFTCWNTRLNCRPSNYGVRIDYVLATMGLQNQFTGADIRPDIMGSDHCPVYADLDDHSPFIKQPSNPEPSAILAANFDEYSGRQKKLSMYFGAKSAAVAKLTDAKDDQDTHSIHQQEEIAVVAPTSANPVRIPTSPATPSNNSKGALSLPPTSAKKRKSSTAAAGGSQKLLKSYFVSPASGNSATCNTKMATACNTISDTSVNSTADSDDDRIDVHALMAEAKERQDAKESWSSLFAARAPPVCRVHQEPCKTMVVNKKGPNQGRQFYLCSRPYGPQGSTGNEYQCDFFQWKTAPPRRNK